MKSLPKEIEEIPQIQATTTSCKHQVTIKVTISQERKKIDLVTNGRHRNVLF